ncbi:nickel-dependent lactate racemase [Acetonema longum]|uniref:Uncharacterized protein n=1 Tax=Acetonema longum DSM 6540 TaxID=1009370 RepID=F7NGG5_9FIRM|nr:nickel-dependent lactate racemase [Acetonema longum]EGO64769.1 hypothetical protein ALO_05765 [Acetonema longum DSM 6540]
MADKIVEFGFGSQTVKFALPAEKIINEIEGQPAQPITDVPAALRQALSNPIDSPPLKKLVAKGDKVAIIGSDITRAWIKYEQFLPALLDELNSAGVPDSDMFIVVGLGGHRAHTPQEDEAVYGKEVCRRVKIYQHDAFDKNSLSYIGKTSRGVEAYINKRVAEADKVILTGGIVYHLMAGFGGGRKSIMPGISAYTSIQGNHLLCMHKEVGKGISSEVGSSLKEGNPMYEDMLEIAALAKPTFLVNSVYTPEGQFARFVAGHWKTAWEEGCREVERIYGIPIAEKADLVVASSGGFPKDINLYQGSKTIDNAYMAAKPNGVIICFMECRDIAEPPEFSDWFKHPTLLDFEKAVRKNFTIPGFVAFKCAVIARENPLIVVTKPENVDFIKKTGMIPATSAEEALAIAKEKLGREDYTITVMGHAANTVPLYKG